MVSLNHRGVDRVAEVVGAEPEGDEFVVGVEGVVHERRRSRAGQLVDSGEDSGKGGLLHPAAVAGAKNRHLQPLQPSELCREPGDHRCRHPRVGLACCPNNGRRGVVEQVQPRITSGGRSCRSESISRRLRRVLA